MIEAVAITVASSTDQVKAASASCLARKALRASSNDLLIRCMPLLRPGPAELPTFRAILLV
jgi:hypothetical protein